MGRWYNEKAEIIETDLRQARKLGLFPSVTSVIKCFDSYGLNLWRNKNIVRVVQENPPELFESDDDYVHRVLDLAKKNNTKASRLGKEIHREIELYFFGESPSLHFDKVTTWIDENIKEIFSVESPIVNLDLEFGGTPDLFCKTKFGNTLIDFKTQEKKEKFKIYPEWNYQLSGLAMLEEVKIDACLNVMISTEPESFGEIGIKHWTEEQIEIGKHIFLLMLDLFKKVKNLEVTEF